MRADITLVDASVCCELGRDRNWTFCALGCTPVSRFGSRYRILHADDFGCTGLFLFRQDAGLEFFLPRSFTLFAFGRAARVRLATCFLHNATLHSLDGCVVFSFVSCVHVALDLTVLVAIAAIAFSAVQVARHVFLWAVEVALALACEEAYEVARHAIWDLALQEACRMKLGCRVPVKASRTILDLAVEKACCEKLDVASYGLTLLLFSFSRPAVAQDLGACFQAPRPRHGPDSILVGLEPFSSLIGSEALDFNFASLRSVRYDSLPPERIPARSTTPHYSFGFLLFDSRRACPEGRPRNEVLPVWATLEDVSVLFYGINNMMFCGVLVCFFVSVMSKRAPTVSCKYYGQTVALPNEALPLVTKSAAHMLALTFRDADMIRRNLEQTQDIRRVLSNPATPSPTKRKCNPTSEERARKKAKANESGPANKSRDSRLCDFLYRLYAEFVTPKLRLEFPFSVIPAFLNCVGTPLRGTCGIPSNREMHAYNGNSARTECVIKIDKQWSNKPKYGSGGRQSPYSAPQGYPAFMPMVCHPQFGGAYPYAPYGMPCAPWGQQQLQGPTYPAPIVPAPTTPAASQAKGAKSKGGCQSCGSKGHARKDCRHYKEKTICNACGKPGHIAKVCYSKNG
jgi:hypothetical protein